MSLRTLTRRSLYSGLVPRPELSKATTKLHFRRNFHQTTIANMPPPAHKMKHLKNINALPSQYPDFRSVLWTGESSQLVVMTVPVGGEIGDEVSGRDRSGASGDGEWHADLRSTTSTRCSSSLPVYAKLLSRVKSLKCKLATWSLFPRALSTTVSR